MRMSLLGLLVFIVAAGCGQSVHADEPKLRPNVVFIMADDLGYGDLGCYGQELIQTPCIDRMAAEGLRFTQCYSGAPVCAPSRCVLMTGLHTGHARVRDNSGKVGGVRDEMSVRAEGHRIPLLDEDVTLAEVLKRNGYATGMTGKWGLGEAGTSGEPNRQGFDEWYGYLNQNHATFYYTDYLWHNGRKTPIQANQSNQRRRYTHDLFTDFALDFIRSERQQPFFLYVAYTIPHFNLEVPELGSYADRNWPDQSKTFAAMITRMDRSVGRILDLLKQLGLDNNTLVFFTSDNGSPLEGGSIFKSNGALKGAKGSLSEGGLRVPMIARWPGKISAGQVSHTVWYFADVLPTIAALTGAAVPPGLDGMSILPTLMGQRQDVTQRRLYWERPPSDFQQAVRWGRWKALRTGPSQPLQLYDLIADPGEQIDVATRHPQQVAGIEAYLKEARTESPYWPNSLIPPTFEGASAISR